MIRPAQIPESQVCQRLGLSPTIYLAEPDGRFRRRCAEALGADGRRVVEVSDIIDLMTIFTWEEGPALEDAFEVLVVAAVQLPHAGALALISGLRHQGECPPFVLMSRGATRTVCREAERAGALATFDKGLGPDQLRRLIAAVSEDQWFVGRRGPVLVP